MKSPPPRIVELDSLRGLAALAVVLYHFTTRYDQLFGHTSATPFSVSWGEYGVDVFFMLSGLMILRSLDRAPTALQFAVGRFARLYPAFWAAAATTFAAVCCFGLPGQEVSLGEAAWNATMLPQLFGARAIDGAYWSLQVELFFYLGVLLLHRSGAFRNSRRLYATLAIWLLAAWAYHGLTAPWAAGVWPAEHWGVSHASALRAANKLQWVFSLRYAHLFALGILLYQAQRTGRTTCAFWLLAAASCAIQGLVDSWGAATLIAVSAIVIQLAARRRLTWLAWRPLGWLGLISYSLYLIHQNVGYLLIRELEFRGIYPLLAVVMAMAICISLAAGLTLGIELRAQNWINRKYAAAIRRFGDSKAATCPQFVGR